MIAPLLAPFDLGSLRVRNRFVMSPMTRGFAPDGVPGDGVAAYYRRRAEGGVGLLISEGVGLTRDRSRHLSSVPRLDGQNAREAWREILDGVHDAGAKMAVQLWHVGGHADPLGRSEALDDLESPSGLIGPNQEGGRPMTRRDITDTITSFAESAAIAADLGFDAVELHAAHGYLIDQFFWAETNRRDDEYGGRSLAERSRFALDVVRAVKAAIPRSVPLVLRVSQWKLGAYDARLARDPAELAAWLSPLAAAGVDLFDCSQRRFWEPAFPDSAKNLSGWIRDVTGKPTMTVGSVGLTRDVMTDLEGGMSDVDLASYDELLLRFAREEFDLVAIGRALLADPRWLKKVREQRWNELLPYEARLAGRLW